MAGVDIDDRGGFAGARASGEKPTRDDTKTLASEAPVGPRTRPIMTPRRLRRARSRLARSSAIRCAGVDADAACSGQLVRLTSLRSLAEAGMVVSAADDAARYGQSLCNSAHSAGSALTNRRIRCHRGSRRGLRR
jgi:hypothetical protein